MANTKTWPDPDTQVAQQGREDVHGVYLLDPTTNKAVSPASGGGGDTQYADGVATPTHPTGTAIVFDNSGTETDVGSDAPLPVTVNNAVALGQSVMSLSSPVVLPTDQSPVPTKAASGAFVANSIVDLTTLLTLLNTVIAAGKLASTETNSAAILAKLVAAPALEGGNLASILTQVTNHTETNSAAILTDVGRIPAQGTAAMAGATPTTIASDDTLVTAIKNSVAAIPAKGAAVTSASTPINIASDQVVPVKRSSVAAYSLASTTTSGSTQNSGDIAVGPYTEISIDINTTAQAGTSPTIQYFYERKGADGIYYVLWQSAVLTAATNTLSTSIGAGMAYNQSLGATGRVRWVVGGSATPTFTMSINAQGK